MNTASFEAVFFFLSKFLFKAFFSHKNKFELLFNVKKNKLINAPLKPYKSAHLTLFNSLYLELPNINQHI